MAHQLVVFLRQAGFFGESSLQLRRKRRLHQLVPAHMCISVLLGCGAGRRRVLSRLLRLGGKSWRQQVAGGAGRCGAVLRRVMRG